MGRVQEGEDATTATSRRQVDCCRAARTACGGSGSGSTSGSTNSGGGSGDGHQVCRVLRDRQSHGTKDKSGRGRVKGRHIPGILLTTYTAWGDTICNAHFGWGPGSGHKGPHTSYNPRRVGEPKCAQECERLRRTDYPKETGTQVRQFTETCSRGGRGRW